VIFVGSLRFHLLAVDPMSTALYSCRLYIHFFAFCCQFGFRSFIIFQFFNKNYVSRIIKKSLHPVLTISIPKTLSVTFLFSVTSIIPIVTLFFLVNYVPIWNDTVFLFLSCVSNFVLWKEIRVCVSLLKSACQQE